MQLEGDGCVFNAAVDFYCLKCPALAFLYSVINAYKLMNEYGEHMIIGKTEQRETYLTLSAALHSPCDVSLLWFVYGCQISEENKFKF